METEPMFRLTDVTKTYGATAAVHSLTLAVDRGEQVALVGPSGAGKTTLLQLLAAVIPPDRGQVTIDGRQASGIKPGRQLARRVGIMHQQFDLVDQLPAVHNVLAGRLAEWGFWRSLLSLIIPREVGRARRALERVGIPDKLYQRTGSLSGGEQQRVALARLLVQAPQALLVDEPVAAVDPARAEDMLEMLIDIAGEQGLTLVVSLHSVDYALHYFDRIIGLRHGRLAFDQSAETVAQQDLDRLYRLEEAPA